MVVRFYLRALCSVQADVGSEVRTEVHDPSRFGVIGGCTSEKRLSGIVLMSNSLWYRRLSVSSHLSHPNILACWYAGLVCFPSGSGLGLSFASPCPFRILVDPSSLVPSHSHSSHTLPPLTQKSAWQPGSCVEYHYQGPNFGQKSKR
jgi:hypothetical protein